MPADGTGTRRHQTMSGPVRSLRPIKRGQLRKWDPPLEPQEHQTEHIMSKIDRSPNRTTAQPHYAEASTRAKAAAAAAAILISTSLLGGLLVLFEMRSLDATAAQTARQNMPSAPAVAEAQSNTAHS